MKIVVDGLFLIRKRMFCVDFVVPIQIRKGKIDMTLGAPDDSDYEGLNERVPGPWEPIFLCINCGKEVDGWNEMCEDCIMET